MSKTPRTRYYRVKAGEPRVLKARDLLNMCCDCGLVHLLRFRVVKVGSKTVIIKRVWRMERATAAARRGKQYKGLRLPKR